MTRYRLDDMMAGALHLADAAPAWSHTDRFAFSDFLIGLAKALSSDADPRHREEAQQCILHIQQKMRAAAKKGAS
jgi:hypothetical protein